MGLLSKLTDSDRPKIVPPVGFEIRAGFITAKKKRELILAYGSNDRILNRFSLFFAFFFFNKAILKYHVVSGAYFSAGLKNDMELTTLQGDKLKIMTDQNSTYKLFVVCKTITILTFM